LDSPSSPPPSPLGPDDPAPNLASLSARSAPAAPARPVSKGLNPAQLQAVQAPIGPLLVLAGAGTGKTRVVIARIGHLVWRGTRPSRILAVTFTNKAAREMLARAAGALGPKVKEKPEISTIHALCARVLRRHAAVMGYPERFAIIDRGEQEATARKVLKELKVPDTTLATVNPPRATPGMPLAPVTVAMDRNVKPTETLPLYDPETGRKVRATER